MKSFLSTVLLWGGIFISNLTAQFSKVDLEIDTLFVYSQEVLYAKVAKSKIQDLKNDLSIERLLVSFRKHLEQIQPQIPEYLIYKITYEKDVNLQVEEVQGIVKYQVEDGESKLSDNQNVAILIDRELKVYLYFNEINDLFTQNYKLMINSGIEKMKKPKFLRRIYFPKDEYFYSYSKGKMVKGIMTDKSKPKTSIVINGSIGFFKNNPIYEFNVGYGLFLGQRKKQFIYGFMGQVYQYNKEFDRHFSDAFIGLSYKSSPKSKLSIMFPLSTQENDVYNDVVFRLSSTYYPVKKVALSVHFFWEKRDIINYPAVSIGFGI